MPAQTPPATVVTRSPLPSPRRATPAEPDDDGPPRRIAWPERAAEIAARPLPAADGAALFTQVWHREPHVLSLADDELARLATWPEYVAVEGGSTLIRQDEVGDYLLLVLDGTLLVERHPSDGPRLRLAEARAGDMLGEMSLLDAGLRFSHVSARGSARLAVLQAEPFHRLMHDEPRLALALMANLSRRLSLRVRQLSARLGALMSPT